ncbi:MAG TPA: LON peptidase substrate-binding domain-containing protein [Bacteroidia bacterium]|jgi:ATP-dependent Lon protease|nr:LON peptidase substrate-binding domain-containing protein [Bacteroidia bacterium]
MVHKLVTLPMFPLNIVLIPGETKVLHIFENRYRELVADCVMNQANFGIPYIKGDQLADYGIEVSIIKIIQEHENGEMDIEIKAIKPFKILKYTSILKPKLYGAAYIEEYEDDTTSNRYKLFRSFKKLIKASKNKEIPVETLTNVSVYKVAHLLDLTNDEKLQLISFATIKEKEDFLIAKIKLYMHMVKLEKEIKGNFRLN